MTGSAIAMLGLIIAGYILFKVIGFIAKCAVVFVALCIGYWYLAPHLNWPLPI
jgi:hypothetical protein